MQSRFNHHQGSGHSDTELLTRTSSVNPVASPIADENAKLVEALMKSKIYQEYGHAFSYMTGLPLKFLPVPVITLPAGPRFGTAGSTDGLGGLWSAVDAGAGYRPAAGSSHDFFFNPCYTIMPVTVKNKVIGYLQTGLMFCHRPASEDFERFAQDIESRGLTADRETLKRAYFAAAVLSEKTQDSALKLLSILAQHLGMLGAQVFSQPRVAEPCTINRARAYIQEHLCEKIYLAQVAKVVNLNAFYFCKIFKRITGHNFTDYVAQLRIEKSKSLLTNHDLSITDVAFSSGFHSLTHFNRVFKKLTGLSPTAFRTQIIGN